MRMTICAMIDSGLGDRSSHRLSTHNLEELAEQDCCLMATEIVLERGLTVRILPRDDHSCLQSMLCECWSG